MLIVDINPKLYLAKLQVYFDKLNSISPTTIQHMFRVGEYAKRLSDLAGLSSFDTNIVFIGGILHDIGKSEIDPTILNKTTRLTDDESKIMQKHAYIGYEIFAQNFDLKNSFNQKIANMILSHHERLDGCGYPYGKTEIDILPQVIAISDSFDAMTENRVYRRGMPVEIALQELLENRGKQFDKYLVDVFVSGILSGDIEFLIKQPSVES